MTPRQTQPQTQQPQPQPAKMEDFSNFFGTGPATQPKGPNPPQTGTPTSNNAVNPQTVKQPLGGNTNKSPDFANFFGTSPGQTTPPVQPTSTTPKSPPNQPPQNKGQPQPPVE